MSKLKVERKLNLDPSDYLCVTYKPRPKVLLPEEPAAFDLNKELERFDRYALSKSQGSYLYIPFPLYITAQAGRFWLTVMECERDSVDMKETENLLKAMTFDVPVTLDEIALACQHLVRSQYGVECSSRAALTDRSVGRFLDIVKRYDNLLTFHPYNHYRAVSLIDHFRSWILPIISEAELETLRSLLRPKIAVAVWPNSPHANPSQLYEIAALAGMPDEIEKVVSKILDSEGDTQYRLGVGIVSILYGLGSQESIIGHARRLKICFNLPRHQREWLAHTQWHALDVSHKDIVKLELKARLLERLKSLTCLDAPELAPIMLEQWVEGKAATVAGKWLRDHPANAIAGVLPLAHGSSKLANAAVEFLREMKRKGHADFIEEQLADVDDEVQKHVREQVLDHEEKEYPMLDDADMPADLKKEFDSYKVPPKSSLPKWLDVSALPPIIVKDAKLSSDNTLSLLHCLKNAPGNAEPDLLKVLRKHAQPQAMDAFVWKLFETWQREGMPSKEKWCFIAVGLFGNDSSALKLTPLIREWPGMSKHQSAVTGLEVLRVIGTDTALMQLNGVAQKVKFQGIKKRAKEMMEAIASDRKMSRAELEDRIVPDLDLDEKGGRTLDFGPRQFRVMLGPDLSPVIKDEDGKVRKDLPKPNSKDDEVKATAAVADWKLLKKQLRETLKLQAPRLENAMTTMRRWNVADFATLFVKHPLLTNLTKRLVWAGYDEKQKQTLTFRVNEEGEFTDASDNTLSLADVACVGIVHPLHMSEPDKQAWGQLFADYEIIPPFEQLGRPVYTLTTAEKKEKVIDRLKGKKIEAIVLHSILEKSEWVRGAPQDGGWFHDHTKVYDSVGLTAVMEYDPGMGVGYMMDSGDQEVTSVFFLKNKDANDTWHFDNKKAITLKEVDPVILSEVLRTLEILGQKEKS